MAMTKKEQAEMERLRKELREARAMRWPDYPPPARVPPPVPGQVEDGHIQGWQFNAYTREVYEQWSTSVTHGRGRYSPEERRHGFGSQNGAYVYATRADALRAMRLALTKEYARLLAEVDQKIEDADA